MKFGCCLNMVSSAPDGIGIEHLHELSEAGYDYVELPLAEMMRLDDSEFNVIKETLENEKIICDVCNNLFPKTMRLTGPLPDSNGKIAEYVEKSLGRVAQLKGQKVVFGSGGAKNVPEGFAIERGYEQIVSLLKSIAKTAKSNNITVVIEPLRKAECNLINTFDEGCRLAEAVDEKNIRVLVDYYHFCEEEEPITNLLRDGKKYLRHIHFAKPEGRRYPFCGDRHDYSRFINAVKELGYNDTLSCEAYSEDYIEDAEKALKFFYKEIV
jgi:D-psicose/D-tagatose/L-ribulose 3-epimerase